MPLPPVEIFWDLLKTIILPAFLVSLAAGVLLLRWKAAGLAMVLGILAANVQNTPMPWFDWNEELGRVCLVLALSVDVLFLDKDKWWKWLLGAGWVGVLSTLLCYHENIELSHRIAVALTSMALFGLISLGEQRLPGWLLLLLLFVTGLAASLVMLHAHTARISDIIMMWMASSAGLLVATRLSKNGLRGLEGPIAVFLPFVLYYGRISTDSQVPIWSFILIIAAPGTCLLCLFKSDKVRKTLVSMFWLFSLVAAVALAMRYESISAG